MAPAAKLRSHGMAGSAPAARAAARMPNTGSTAPERAPPRKARPRDRPPSRRGRATAAPSGKFWMPMPRASAAAAASPSPSGARAKASPTAMPSGTLWRVMAVTSSALCRQAPSSGRRCRRGSRASSAPRKTTPASIPTAAGSAGGTSAAAARSMAGSSRLHTEAAVITPAAKPSSVRRNRGLGSPVRKNTMAAPRAVIPKVKPVPRAARPSAYSIIATPSLRFGRNGARMPV